MSKRRRRVLPFLLCTPKEAIYIPLSVTEEVIEPYLHFVLTGEGRVESLPQLQKKECNGFLWGAEQNGNTLLLLLEITHS